ncbi:MAG: heavy metal-associated domain-containing protein [Planctomycetota bacterium]
MNQPKDQTGGMSGCGEDGCGNTSGETRPAHTNGHLNLPHEEAMRADARTDSVAGDAMLLFKVAGMTCHRCEDAVGEALRGVRGVKEAEIDFNSGSASVLYDPKVAEPAALAEAINDSGYDVVSFQKLGGK